MSTKSRILKLTFLTLCLSASLFAQAKSQLEFFDSTGATGTAKIGWSGTATDGKFSIETPNDGENVSVQRGVLTAKTIVSADGSGISKIDTAKILGLSAALGNKASVASVNVKADRQNLIDSITSAKKWVRDTFALKATVGVSAAAVLDSLKSKADTSIVNQKFRADSASIKNLTDGKASLSGANFTGNVGIGTSSPKRELDLNTTGNLTFGDNVTVGDNARGLFWHSGSGYGIFRENKPWTYPYPELKIGWDAGISFDANPALGGAELPGFSFNGGNVGVGTRQFNYAKFCVADTTRGGTKALLRLADFTNNVDENLNIYLTPVGTLEANRYADISSYAKTSLCLNATSGGNVGIGTSNPQAKLQVNLTAVSGSIDNINDYGSGRIHIFANGDNNTETAITYSGQSGGGAAISFGRGNLWETYIGFYTTANNGSGPQEEIIERMRISQLGFVGIGTKTPRTALDVCGTITSTYSLAVNNSCSSDRRFKTNITPLTTSLTKIQSLQGVNYDWDRTAFPVRNFPEGKQIGLIAQDVEKVIPEVVHTDAEGYKSLSYDKLTAVLIEAVKEQQRQIEELRAEVAKIKGR